jgi:hypothetical protein
VGTQGVRPSTIKIYIRFEFRATWILPLNPKVIDEKFSFVEVYKTQPTNKEETKDSNSEHEEKEDQQWGEELVIEELLNK